MPPLEMRGRYIQREWFTDTELQTKVTADVREFYFGLAMLADDEGWMPRDVVGIGAAIYRFRAIDEREAMVRANLEVLGRLGKVRSTRCKCLFLPTVARTPRAGKKTDLHFKAHQKHSNTGSNGFERIQKDLNPSPVLSRPDPSPAGAGAHEAPRRGRMTAIGDIAPRLVEVAPGKFEFLPPGKAS